MSRRERAGWDVETHELLAKRDVQRANAAADRGREGALDANLCRGGKQEGL